MGQILIDADSAQWFGSGPQATTENSGLGRVDWKINDKMSVFARFNDDAFTSSKPDHINPLTAFHNESQPSAVIDVQNTFTPTILNDFRYGFNRTVSLEGQSTQLPFLLSISPFSTLDTSSGTTRNDNSYSFIDKTNVDTDWYFPQPFLEPLDLTKSDEEIIAETQALCAAQKGYEPYANWRARIAMRMTRFSPPTGRG